MTSARRPNKTSPIHTASLKDNVAFTHRQKCLCGSRGVPHHTPRDPGKALARLPLCALGNRLADLGPDVAHEPAPATLSHGLGAPGKHCLRQPTTDGRVHVEVQVFSREVLAQHWRKKNPCLDTWERVSGTADFTDTTPSQDSRD